MITLVVIAVVPNEAGQFLKFRRADIQLRDVLLNLSVLSLQTSDLAFCLVPPVWSVAIEVEMYLMLYLVMARRLAWALVALVAALFYHLGVLLCGVSLGGALLHRAVSRIAFRGRRAGLFPAPAPAIYNRSGHRRHSVCGVVRECNGRRLDAS